MRARDSLEILLNGRERRIRLTEYIIRNYNGEFDPGSGRTLAAGLTHASRRRKLLLAMTGDWRTGE